MQEVGIPDGLYRNLHDYFAQQRNPKFALLGRRLNGRKGETGNNSERVVGGNPSKTSESDKGVLKEFCTKDGEVYGFTDGEKIYLDTKRMKPETPLHEYTHLWSAALRRVNPKEWENVKGLLDKVLADWAKGFDPRKVGDGVETPSHEEEPHRTKKTISSYMEKKKDIRKEKAAIMLQAMRNLQKKQAVEMAKRSLKKPSDK